MKRHRLIVEDAIGALKMRFGILRQQLRFKIKSKANVFFTCVILHNFLIDTGTPLRPLPENEQEEEMQHSSDEDNTQGVDEVEDDTAAENIRSAYASMAWNSIG